MLELYLADKKMFPSGQADLGTLLFRGTIIFFETSVFSRDALLMLL